MVVFVDLWLEKLCLFEKKGKKLMDRSQRTEPAAKEAAQNDSQDQGDQGQDKRGEKHMGGQKRR